MIEIRITQANESTAEIDEKLFNTSGYLLLFLKGDKIEFTGNMELRTLGPYLTKLIMEKVMQSQTQQGV